MLLTSAGVEPATSWSPVGWRIQLSQWQVKFPVSDNPVCRGGQSVLLLLIQRCPNPSRYFWGKVQGCKEHFCSIVLGGNLWVGDTGAYLLVLYTVQRILYRPQDLFGVQKFWFSQPDFISRIFLFISFKAKQAYQISLEKKIFSASYCVYMFKINGLEKINLYRSRSTFSRW